MCVWACSRPLSLLQGVLYCLASSQRVKDYTGQRVEAGGRVKRLRKKSVCPTCTCMSAGSGLPLGVTALCLQLHLGLEEGSENGCLCPSLATL